MIIQRKDCQIRDLFVALVKTNCCSVCFRGFTNNTSKWVGIGGEFQEPAAAFELSKGSKI